MKPEQNILLAADAVVFDDPSEKNATTGVQEGIQILLVTRADNGKFALPGGLLNDDETFLQASVRECEEETGVILDPDDVLCAFVADEPGRDPRGRCVTTAYVWNKSKFGTTPVDTDTLTAAWYDLEDILKMARSSFFADHLGLIREAAEEIYGDRFG